MMIKANLNEKPVKKPKRKRRMPQVLDKALVEAERRMELSVVNDRRYKVAEMLIRGKIPSVIARLLDVDIKIISKDIGAIREEWFGIASEDIVRLRADEYARLLREQDLLEDAYQRSCEARTVTSATKVGPGGQPITKATTFKRDGDPRWRALVLKCIEQRCKLLNLNVFDESQQQSMVVVVPHTKILYDLPPPIKQVEHEASSG